MCVIGYSLAYGDEGLTEGEITFVGRGNYFATGSSPSFWFFGKIDSVWMTFVNSFRRIFQV